MTRPSERAVTTLRMTSSAFDHGDAIPRKYTCQGPDVSPPLAWEGVPEEAKTLALVMDDPDAPGGTWLHWTFWDLPSTHRKLAEAADLSALGAKEGENGWGRTGWGGPCPPSGTHRYFFKLYALDGPLGLPAGADLDALMKAMMGRIVGRTELIGTYAKG